MDTEGFMNPLDDIFRTCTMMEKRRLMKRLFPFLLLCISFSGTQAQFAQIGQQLDGNAPNDNFGWSVALDAVGQILAVGAPLYDDDFGQVRVYKESVGTWTQLGGDIEGNEIGQQFGFTVKLNASGNRLALSGLAGSSTPEGHARVYEWQNGQWAQMGQTLTGVVAGDQFGFSLDMNAAGDRIVIGSPKSNNNGTDSGSITAFEWNGTSWMMLGATSIAGVSPGDEFGNSVAMSADGNTLAVGASKHAPNGQVQVFQWQNNAWNQLGMDIEGQNADEFFGLSVSLSDDGRTLVANASSHNHGSGIGSVRVYEFINNNWAQVGMDIRGTSNSEAFGQAVGISGDGLRIAIGTQSNDDNATSSGKVNLFEWQNGTWTELLDPIKGAARFDNLGKSVDLNQNGNRVAIGANLAGGTQGYTVVYQDSIMPVSVDNYFDDHQIDIFANEQVLTLHSERQLGEVQVKIWTLDGKLLIREGFAHVFDIHLHHDLLPGLYVIALEHKEGILWRKMMIP